MRCVIRYNFYIFPIMRYYDFVITCSKHVYDKCGSYDFYACNILGFSSNKCVSSFTCVAF